MHHYDKNLNYINELLWHFCYDADTALLRQHWSTLLLHLDWKKRNFDPDDDGLYDSYCCIWASDALYYSGGAVTHSSAYMLRALRMAVKTGRLLNEETDRIEQEEKKIQEAINRRLWINSENEIPAHWAEYEYLLGLWRLHSNAALWTVYTAIDCMIGSTS